MPSDFKADKHRSTLLVLYIPSGDRFGKTLPKKEQDRWVRRALRVLGETMGGATAFPRGLGVWRDDAQGEKECAQRDVRHVAKRHGVHRSTRSSRASKKEPALSKRQKVARREFARRAGRKWLEVDRRPVRAIKIRDAPVPLNALEVRVTLAHERVVRERDLRLGVAPHEPTCALREVEPTTGRVAVHQEKPDASWT